MNIAQCDRSALSGKHSPSTPLTLPSTVTRRYKTEAVDKSLLRLHSRRKAENGQKLDPWQVGMALGKRG